MFFLRTVLSCICKPQPAVPQKQKTEKGRNAEYSYPQRGAKAARCQMDTTTAFSYILWLTGITTEKRRSDKCPDLLIIPSTHLVTLFIGMTHGTLVFLSIKPPSFHYVFSFSCLEPWEANTTGSPSLPHVTSHRAFAYTRAPGTAFRLRVHLGVHLQICSNGFKF